MLAALQAYYLSASAALFLYAVYSNKNAVHAFAMGIALNIFPLMFTPYMSMDIARIAGMPLAYLPVTSAGFALAVRNRLRWPRAYRTVLVIALLFCVYSFVTTIVIGGATVANFAYWVAWPLNFIIFFSAAGFFSRVDRALANKVIKWTAMILVAGCLVGLLRLATGIAEDANFMPVVNRNGTVVFIAMIAPLLFYIYEQEHKSRTWLLVCTACVALGATFIYSRSGLIGLGVGVFLYYMRFTLAGLLKPMVAALVIAVFVASGIADKSVERLERISGTVQMVMHGDQLDNSMNDYNRVMLLTGAIETARENFWFGTGLGLDNYRRSFHKASNYTHDSKAHNFYVSYFAELGILGFSMLLWMLLLISRLLPPLAGRHKAFKVSFIVMAVMMTMNEYILLPELWFFFGMLAGMSQVANRSYSLPPVSAPIPRVNAHRLPGLNRPGHRATHG
jgi:hypothetical protein